ncbi:hypothetical protein BJ508DRAFT_336987 [Ascobolus immersus RN42]|uniref:Uncharacterized protein n=1 Tax=Ascobolus immersus RN42 TaxID=1160509 RepID=A0A3N4H6P2_ASCIM|nr:hypothetical protein BJ508DRAFT_336987 [Ascobolus immersus RN42]
MKVYLSDSDSSTSDSDSDKSKSSDSDNDDSDDSNEDDSDDSNEDDDSDESDDSDENSDENSDEDSEEEYVPSPPHKKTSTATKKTGGRKQRAGKGDVSFSHQKSSKKNKEPKLSKKTDKTLKTPTPEPNDGDKAPGSSKTTPSTRRRFKAPDWMSMREVERTVIPQFAAALELWEPKDGRLPFNFTGGTGERTLLGTYLHQGKYLSSQPNNLRTIINAFCMLKNSTKKQDLVSSGAWEELLQLLANSEFLAPDVRAVLLYDPHSNIRWKFYRILVDSFVQNTLKTLRTTINTARGEWQEFYNAVESGSNEFPGYAMPRAIPQLTKNTTPFVFWVLDPDSITSKYKPLVSLNPVLDPKNPSDVHVGTRFDWSYPEFATLDYVVEFLSKELKRLPRQIFGFNSTVDLSIKKSYAVTFLSSCDLFDQWYRSNSSNAPLWIKVILQTEESREDTPPPDGQHLWLHDNLDEWLEDERHIRRYEDPSAEHRRALGPIPSS